MSLSEDLKVLRACSQRRINYRNMPYEKAFDTALHGDLRWYIKRIHTLLSRHHEALDMIHYKYSLQKPGRTSEYFTAQFDLHMACSFASLEEMQERVPKYRQKPYYETWNLMVEISQAPKPHALPQRLIRRARRIEETNDPLAPCLRAFTSNYFSFGLTYSNYHTVENVCSLFRQYMPYWKMLEIHKLAVSGMKTK